jgi:hypothetical protein
MFSKHQQILWSNSRSKDGPMLAPFSTSKFYMVSEQGQAWRKQGAYFVRENIRYVGFF